MFESIGLVRDLPFRSVKSSYENKETVRLRKQGKSLDCIEEFDRMQSIFALADRQTMSFMNYR